MRANSKDVRKSSFYLCINSNIPTSSSSPFLLLFHFYFYSISTFTPLAFHLQRLAFTKAKSKVNQSTKLSACRICWSLAKKGCDGRNKREKDPVTQAVVGQDKQEITNTFPLQSDDRSIGKRAQIARKRERKHKCHTSWTKFLINNLMSLLLLLAFYFFSFPSPASLLSCSPLCST